VKWAFGFPGELSADAQPAIAGGRIFVGTQSGTVYALSSATGCVHWTFQADAAVRAAITIARIESGGRTRAAAFVGDRSGRVYALDAATGAQIWKVRVDDHPFARVTASPTVHEGRVYVGVASGEETAGAAADYQCCTFRGSLVEAPRACRTRDRCSPTQSAAVSAIPGVTFSGAIDGHLRAYSTRDGLILWDVDTAQTYQTVNGVPARGGSINVAGPAVAGGTVVVNSGYVQNGRPGNVLLAFTVDGK
jgi:outer membrane protein assembly factor BamB